MTKPPLDDAPQLVLATGNPGKCAEFQAIFNGLVIELAPQSEYAVPESPEPHCTFVENALAKARHASAHTALPALADDSGLCVLSLGGEPGVWSARYAQPTGDPAADRATQDALNNAKLLSELSACTDRRAHFVCVLAAVRRPDDPEPLIAHGWLHGRIAMKLEGTGGFGYDPLFVLNESGATLAQLLPEDKNRVSHRARAAGQMAQLLQAFWGVQRQLGADLKR
ncbi:MAG: RdgB/HAM1 family non-canonical purine NTP pyrophosphatase [Proteobacteria bacterium]|nr:RdgB/HAM1 family non-canonical purine NTP pyrophosphatase [Pseudomonadota bacterium]